MTTYTDTQQLARAAMVSIGNAVVVGAQAVATTTRRIVRAMHAVITVTRRHVPAWLAAALGAALFIPGPFDEIAIGLCISFYAMPIGAWSRYARKHTARAAAMRADFARTVPQAWKGVER